MSEAIVLAERLRALEGRLARMEAQEHGHDQYLLASGARLGAAGQAQEFTFPVIAPWFDLPVAHAVDSDYFNQFAAGSPAGWVEADAAANSAMNVNRGFWRIGGTATDTAWKYRRRLAAIAEATYWGVLFGPILWRDGAYANDLTYTLGIYRDNGSGTIDETQYNRMELYWNSASAVWQVRSVITNGSTTYTSSYLTLTAPPVQPLFLRVTARADSNAGKRGYVGTSPLALTQTMLQDRSLAITFGQPWVQLTMSRGAAGADDYLFFGGFDRLGNA